MQIEHKLQVATMALLLSLIAIAGPANSQVSGVEDCDETNTVPVPPDFTTCLDDAEPDTTGVPCVDETAECPAPDTSCAEDFPAVEDCVPAGEPCAEGEIGQDPACVADPTTGLPCVDETAECPTPDTSCAEDFPAVEDCVPAGEPCAEGEIGQDPACVADPTVGVPCVDETADCPTPDASCAEDFPAVEDCVPAGEPCAEGELGVQAPACVADPTTGLPCVDETADCPIPDAACADDPPAVEDCVPEGGLDALCAVLNAEAANPTFPACLLELVTGGPLPPGCDPAGEGFPQEECALPDPTATNTPPTANAGVDGAADEFDVVALDGTASDDDDDPLTYDWSCDDADIVVAAPAALDTSFTAPEVGVAGQVVTCTLTVADGADQTSDTVVFTLSNTAPTADAGEDQTVNEGDVVDLLGDASGDIDEPLTYDWACEPVVALSTAVELATSFTAPDVDADGLDITCTLTADDGGDQASDEVVIHVNDVVITTLELDFTIDALAAQETDNAVLVTGTVTPNIAVDDALISVALTSVGLAGSGAENIVWADGDVTTLDLSAGSPEAFEVLVSWNQYEVVTWTITVTAPAGSGSEAFSVTFDDTATSIQFGAGNAPASLALAPLSQSSYQPDGAAVSNLGTTLTISDTNGNGDGTEADYGRIVDLNAASDLTNDGDAADTDDVLIGAGTNNGILDRDYPLSIDLPSRLSVGTYTLGADYINPLADNEAGPASLTASVGRSLAVENVAPVIAVGALGDFLGTERVESVGTVDIQVDDYNAGTLTGGNVAALSSLGIAVREAAGGLCTGDIVTQGLTLSFPETGGAEEGGAALDFSDVAFNAPVDVTVSVAWASTALAGSYELCATLTDAGGLEAANVLLADLLLTALNGGFHLTIDDGGDGLAAPVVNPGQTTSTEALGIAFTGTLGAEELELTVGDFVRTPGGLTFTAADLSGKLCLAAACAPADLVQEVDAVDGVVSFVGLSAVAPAGSELFVQFSFSVPLGTAAGNYAAPIVVGAVEA